MATSSQEDTIYFQGATARDLKDLETEIETTLADIRSGKYDNVLKQINIDPTSLASLSTPWRLDKPKPLTGFEGIIIGVLIREGVKFGRKALTDVWSRIVLPRLEQRYSPRLGNKPPTNTRSKKQK
jgi:hypothetical protein